MTSPKFHYSHWLPEEERELRELYAEGISILEISKKAIFRGRRTEKAISEKLRDLDRKGVLSLDRLVKVIPELVEKVFSLREEGKTLSEIGKELRLSTGTVKTILYRI